MEAVVLVLFGAVALFWGDWLAFIGAMACLLGSWPWFFGAMASILLEPWFCFFFGRSVLFRTSSGWVCLTWIWDGFAEAGISVAGRLGCLT